MLDAEASIYLVLGGRTLTRRAAITSPNRLHVSLSAVLEKEEEVGGDQVAADKDLPATFIS